MGQARLAVHHVAALLFGSGLCALVYQVAWFRELRLIFGASTAASAAVLAIFMGGIGVGGLVLGRVADRVRRPLLLYAILEAGIALFTLITPNLLDLVRWVYLSLGGSSTLGATGGAAARVLLAGVVLTIPTVLMGGTLPAAARAVESDDDPSRRRVGVLYGVNTLGAVAGCFAVTFFLLEIFGTALSLRMACLVNLLVAALAYRAARTAPALAPARAEAESSASAEAGQRPASSFVLTAAAIAGFAFFLMEIVWYRMLGPLLGGTVYTFGLILGVALLGIGVGGAYYSAYMRHRPATLAAFAYTCLFEAAAIAIPLALGDEIAVLTRLLRPLEVLGFAGLVGSWTAVALLVIFPVAFFAGVQFPLLIALLGRGGQEVGRQVGLTYLFNTAGAIAGSLAGGFGLIPLLGATGCWRMVALLLAAVGIGAIFFSARSERRWLRLIAPAATAVAVLVLSAAPGPSSVWKHAGIGVGRTPLWSTANQLESWRLSQNRRVEWQVDGVESSIALVVSAGFAFSVNGKIDGHARLDAPTQVMLGVIGALLHPAPRSAAVIGLGTGSSAGWLAAIPTMENVVVMELEPAVVDVARACEPVNHGALESPKLELVIGDARETLLTMGRRFDLIASEPSNPYRAGIASLFTEEYYRAVADRLDEDGIFVQWVQAYEVDARTLRAIYATLAAVFPHVETWQIGTGDLALVASARPIAHDPDRLRARIAEPGYREAFLYAWRAVELEDVLGRFVGGPALARAIAEDSALLVNTDDENHVEFGFARMLGRGGFHNMQALRNMARELRAHRLELGPGIDWERVTDGETAVWLAGMEPPPRDPPYYSKFATARLRAFRAWARSDLEGGLEQWRRQPGPPRTPDALALFAEALAVQGNEEALEPIERLRALMPAEADAITAALRAAQARFEEAALALESAFLRYRSDPWPTWPVMKRALRLAPRIAAGRPELARRLERALAQRFAVASLDESRAQTRALVAMQAGGDACREAIAAYEPYPVWELGFLSMRARCYQQTGDPRLEQAQGDLARFTAAEPEPFWIDGPAAPPPASGLLPEPERERDRDFGGAVEEEAASAPRRDR